jgi:hypothetical protein
LHGFLLIEPRDNPAAYDQEVFLGLHDWNGQFLSGDDGYMNPVCDVATINGKMLGSGDPVKVKQGERVMMHILNSSPTEVHWISFSGHSFKVVALDGNPVAQAQTVSMLRLAPAERVSAIVEMNNPGVWVLGEVRKHVQASGMGVVIEYANGSGKPVWTQPENLVWNYRQFAGAGEAAQHQDAKTIELVFDSKFQGHGNEELWRINGLVYPQNSTPPCAGVGAWDGQEHETLELTEGITSWSEIGFYVFTGVQDGHGVQWVGDHIRPRVRAPDSWHLPVGLSLSTEIGYQRAVYSPDTWTWEIRPIIDKTVGRWYFAFNPALERTLHGPDVKQGVGFSPGVKVSYDFTRVVSGANWQAGMAGFHTYSALSEREAKAVTERYQLGEPLQRPSSPQQHRRSPVRDFLWKLRPSCVG